METMPKAGVGGKGGGGYGGGGGWGSGGGGGETMGRKRRHQSDEPEEMALVAVGVMWYSISISLPDRLCSFLFSIPCSSLFL